MTSKARCAHVQIKPAQTIQIIQDLRILARRLALLSQAKIYKGLARWFVCHSPLLLSGGTNATRHIDVQHVQVDLLLSTGHQHASGQARMLDAHRQTLFEDVSPAVLID